MGRPGSKLRYLSPTCIKMQEENITIQEYCFKEVNLICKKGIDTQKVSLLLSIPPFRECRDTSFEALVIKFLRAGPLWGSGSRSSQKYVSRTNASCALSPLYPPILFCCLQTCFGICWSFVDLRVCLLIVHPLLQKVGPGEQRAYHFQNMARYKVVQGGKGQEAPLSCRLSRHCSRDQQKRGRQEQLLAAFSSLPTLLAVILVEGVWEAVQTRH